MDDKPECFGNFNCQFTDCVLCKVRYPCKVAKYSDCFGKYKGTESKCLLCRIDKQCLVKKHFPEKFEERLKTVL